MPLVDDIPAALWQILEERARQLAQPAVAEATADVLDVVVLTLAPERLGVDVRGVQEIQPAGRFARLPGVPAFWAGLANVRGRLYPVLDLRRYLGLPLPASRRGKVVLVAAAALEIGLLVDDVADVQRVQRSRIGPPLADTASHRCMAVVGVTPDLLSIVDLEILLADPALVVRGSMV